MISKIRQYWSDVERIKQFLLFFVCVIGAVGLYIAFLIKTHVTMLPDFIDNGVVGYITSCGLLWLLIWIFNVIYCVYDFVYHKNMRKFIFFLFCSIVLAGLMAITYKCATKNLICTENTSGIRRLMYEDRVPFTMSLFMGMEQLAYVFFLYGKRMVSFLDEKCKGINLSQIGFAVLVVIAPVLANILCELNANYAYNEISFSYIFFAIFTAALIEWVFILLPIRSYIGLLLFVGLYWLLGAVNYYVISFRGTPFVASDITSFSTAMKVVGGYRIYPTDRTFFTFLIYLIFAALTITFSNYATSKISAKKMITKCGCMLIAICLAVNWIYYADWQEKYGIAIDWQPIKCYRIWGTSTGFFATVKQLRVEKPDGYSKKNTIKVLSEMSNNATDTVYRPTIIGIMNESFSDLSILGPFEYSDRDMNFFKSLQNSPNTLEFGINYLSAHGGGTSNTEFEALTGDSRVLVNGMIPYNMLNFATFSSFPSVLKNVGYQTTAMHPNVSSNYKRNSVYKGMKFEEFWSLDNAYANMNDYRGWVVSDADDYSELIRCYEEKKNNGQQYIFNVTMQNHGGYFDGELTVREDIGEYNDNLDVGAYEYLISQSDLALKNLIEYFEKVDEPVIIYFFGDHQPNLNEEFVQELLTKGQKNDESDFDVEQKKYGVPYFIWANYEVNKLGVELYKKDGLHITSPLYLSASVAAYAGQGYTNYYQYLVKMRGEIPALNVNGYMDKIGQWHELSEANDTVEQYYSLEYCHLFDNSNTKGLFD